jgi:nucleotide-binding universal stress UspA family protein
MKILIGYDGSDCADAALDDLMRAGLPEIAEAQILSVAEVWLPPPPPTIEEMVQQARQVKVPADLKRVYSRIGAAVKAAQQSVERASDRVKTNFPKWTVCSQAASGSAAWELLFKADEFKPSLIVVGSHGRSALGRLVLGSISQKVLTEAACSVRVARGRVEEPDTPLRIIVGLDGSPGSFGAVSLVATRNWPTNTEVKLVIVNDEWSVPIVEDLIPAVGEAIEEEKSAEMASAEKIAAQAESIFQGSRLRVSRLIREGDPKSELPKIAEEWGADCIFVGSTGFSNRLERFVLGSVSAAVAARAHCSVEVVRSLSVDKSSPQI